MAKRLRVYQDENGSNYAKQHDEDQHAAWLLANPTHTLIR